MTQPGDTRIVNVASVKHLSPFRYPGGKTWFVPRLREWLVSLPQKPALFIEPFAGGAIISLTVASERLAEHVLFVELDSQVAAVWETVLSDDADWLCDKILSFDLTPENADRALAQPATSTREKAFQTILRNRINRGGILAPGAGRVKHGENGRGIRSRWYPTTLCKRIRYIRYSLRERLTFVHGDGMTVLQQYADREDVAYFIDPPYTASGKRAGARLYRHHRLDHPRLFEIASRIRGNFLMTYENNAYIRGLAARHNFSWTPVAMKNTHHAKMTELVIYADRQ
ncbi:MAG TPA: DNA adenine methylase [Anaerolineae bacterium]|nr:DNA adenine methylase [Anaerolineae bacterium]